VGAANRTVTKLEQVDADGAALRCPSLVTDGLVTTGEPSNLPKGFQRFGFEKLFQAGGFSDLG